MNKHHLLFSCIISVFCAFPVLADDPKIINELSTFIGSDQSKIPATLTILDNGDLQLTTEQDTFSLLEHIIEPIEIAQRGTCLLVIGDDIQTNRERYSKLINMFNDAYMNLQAHNSVSIPTTMLNKAYALAAHYDIRPPAQIINLKTTRPAIHHDEDQNPLSISPDVSMNSDSVQNDQDVSQPNKSSWFKKATLTVLGTVGLITGVMCLPISIDRSNEYDFQQA